MTTTTGRAAEPAPLANQANSATYLLRLVIGLGLIGIALWGAWTFPVASLPLVASLVLYVVVLSRWPASWLIVVPVATAVLDLTYWSGRVFFNEFDLVLLATLGAGMLRRERLFSGGNRGLWAIAALIAAYQLLTIWIGLGGTDGIAALANGDSLRELWRATDYYQNTNALREGKGPLWALALLPLLVREAHCEPYFQRWCSVGIVAALGLSGAIVLWERALYTGLFNFSHPYRVSGSFFGMHTGGAALDAFLVIALPFTAAGYLLWRDRRAALIGAAAAWLCIYAIYVTYSRANYPAVAVVLLLLGAGLLIQRSDFRATLRQLTWRRVVGALAAAALVVGLMSGGAIEKRFSTTVEDFYGRIGHYTDTLALMEEDSGKQIFGLGKGRFPAAYYVDQMLGDNHLATAVLHPGDAFGSAFVRFSKSDRGGSLFLRQRFDPTTEQRLRLQFRARVVGKRSEFLHIEFCERHMLKFLAECHDEGTAVPPNSGEWETFNREFNVGNLGQRGIGPIRTPVDISVMNRGFHQGLEVDKVQLFTMDGRPLLKNPQFESGLDHWFISYNNHLRFHIKNLLVYLFFEGGVVALVVLLIVVLATARALWRRVFAGDAFALMVAASLAGTFFVGLFDSLLDDPRIAFLSFLLVWLALVEAANRGLVDAASPQPQPEVVDDGRFSMRIAESDRGFLQALAQRRGQAVSDVIARILTTQLTELSPTELSAAAKTSGGGRLASDVSHDATLAPELDNDTLARLQQLAVDAGVSESRVARRLVSAFIRAINSADDSLS